ncbi:hypothetical protein [Lentilactobacillus kosonis]|uniref:Lipoprotein n=1 Tax=Lentilactobacillus kosonis TaxID=2810561 RepID=A0A401FM38_9LACO|nr:hypothetical protein [Lentilactobacillus kosonis]GAY73444.1 hypothetical protein NBRC111893_1590 [Lentilactobacillus kosonis]
MRKIVKILIACLSGLLITACSSNNEAQVTIPNRQTNKMVLAKYQMRSNPVNKQRAKQLSRFIKANMLAKQGIYTNLSQQKQPAELATGHEMLSESSGMWLTYLALNKQTKAIPKIPKPN